jgi:hypothetical protein
MPKLLAKELSTAGQSPRIGSSILLPLSEWRARQQFEMKVKEALSTSVLIITQARGSAKRQRSYILAYAYLHKGEEAGEGAAAANEFADIKKWQNYKRLTSQQLIKIQQHTLQSLKWSRTTLMASAMEQKAPSLSFAACSLVGGSFVIQIFISIENFMYNKCPHVEHIPETGNFYGTCLLSGCNQPIQIQLLSPTINTFWQNTCWQSF